MNMYDWDENLIKNALESVKTPDFDIVKGVEARMKSKKGIARRGIVLGFLAACFMVVTVAAAAYVSTGSDLLRTFFSGGTIYLEEHVQTPGEYVTDGRYVLTVEQTLATTHQALVIFSVEALTYDAIAVLNATCENGFSTFMGMDTIDFGPADRQTLAHNGSTVLFGGWSQHEIVERRTDTKRYFAIAASDMVNENGEDFFIRLNKMADAQKIIISMVTNIETHEFVLTCAIGEYAVLRLTPLGLTLERTVSGEGDILANMVSGLYFRTSDGEINTFNQLLRKDAIKLVEWSEYGNEYIRYEMVALFREITSMTELAGIILGNVEHDVNDTTLTTPFTPDSTIQQFMMQPYLMGHLWIPLEELCKQIGAYFRWDSEANTATVVYRNSTFVIEVDSSIIIRNGESIDLLSDDTTFMSQDSGVIVSSRLFDLMGIGVTAINQFDEYWNARPLSEWMWIVMP